MSLPTSQHMGCSSDPREWGPWHHLPHPLVQQPCASSQEAQPPLKHVLSLPLRRLCTSSAGPHNTTAASAFTLHTLARQTNKLCECVTKRRIGCQTVQSVANQRQHEPRFVDLPPFAPHGAPDMHSTQTKALSTGTKQHPHWHISTTKSHCSTVPQQAQHTIASEPPAQIPML